MNYTDNLITKEIRVNIPKIHKTTEQCKKPSTNPDLKPL